MVFVSVQDYETKAKEILPKNAYDFFSSGSYDEFSLKRNRNVFQKIFLRPRVLRDASETSTVCNLFGNEHGLPIGVAPTAMHKLAHSNGEIGTAKAAAKHKTVYIMSTISSTTIEELSAAAPDTIKWLQLYVFTDREKSKDFIRKAEKLNFKALVITVDLPVGGIRRVEARRGFTVPDHIEVANFPDLTNHSRVDREGKSGVGRFVKGIIDPSISWEDIRPFVQFTKLPIILKGILTVEDALIAVELGCKGIIVSNHGGRQLDSVLSPIEVLPEIARAVGDKVVVMMDGGITNGLDVYKALALGAKFVFIGRSVLWGLAVNGEDGVDEIFSILKNELEVGMALCGTPKIDLITKDYIIYHEWHSKL